MEPRGSKWYNKETLELNFLLLKVQIDLEFLVILLQKRRAGCSHVGPRGAEFSR